MNRGFEIADRSYDRSTGELTQFLLFWDDGMPELKKATPENVLLYDPEDKLPFDNGLYEFLSGEHLLLLSENPLVVISSTKSEYSYIIRYKSNTVETTPRQAEDVLQAIVDYINGDGISSLIDVYDEVMSSQVRKWIIDCLLPQFTEQDRIKSVANGWLIDGFYLVDWFASLYTIEDDPDQPDYVRSGSEAILADKSYEFVHLHINDIPTSFPFYINGEEERLTEREILFLAKVKWLLNRRHYHGDQPFWKYTDKWAEVDSQTGEPVEIDAPDLDSFSL